MNFEDKKQAQGLVVELRPFKQHLTFIPNAAAVNKAINEHWPQLSNPQVKENHCFCTICHSIIKDPVMLPAPCFHSFCKTCIEKSHSIKPECPTCHCAIPSRFNFGVCWRIGEQINKFEVTCPVCSRSLKIEEWRGRHMGKECPEVEGSCSACSAIMRVKDWKEHSNVCPRRLVTCQVCLTDVKFDEMDDHSKSKCPKAMTKCPTCLVEMPRQELKEHDCPETEYPCPTGSSECPKIKAKDMESHLKDKELFGRHLYASMWLKHKGKKRPRGDDHEQPAAKKRSKPHEGLYLVDDDKEELHTGDIVGWDDELWEVRLGSTSDRIKMRSLFSSSEVTVNRAELSRMSEIELEDDLVVSSKLDIIRDLLVKTDATKIKIEGSRWSCCLRERVSDCSRP